MFERVRGDIQSVFHRDPAARNVPKVPIRYPGLHAVWLYRLAHGLWTSDWKWLARLVPNLSRRMTDIEIHPGARIGRRLFIDYGMDIVIGETTEIGDDVTLHQSVVLGGTTQNKGKRHPTLGNSVVVGAGTKVSDPPTVGEGAKIGSNVVVTKEVPPGATVVGIPGRVIMCENTEQQVKRRAMAEKLGFDAYEVDQDMPDPMAHAIGQLLDYLQTVDGRFEGMRQTLIALGSDYCAKDLPVLRKEDLAGVKDEDGNLAA